MFLTSADVTKSVKKTKCKEALTSFTRSPVVSDNLDNKDVEKNDLENCHSSFTHIHWGKG